MGRFSGVKRVLLRPLTLVGLNQLSMLWKFHGIVKDQERKEERNGITEEIKTEIMSIKLFSMKIY